LTISTKKNSLYSEDKIKPLIGRRIIRNKLKVRSAVSNESVYETGRIWQFSKYIWNLQGTYINKTLKRVPPLPTF
jgi:3-methyladenine DNA glycosylase Tag